MLGESFDCELPQFQISSTEQLLNASKDHAQVLFVQIQLALEQHSLEGYVAFVLGNASLLNLHKAVTRFLHGATNP